MNPQNTPITIMKTNLPALRILAIFLQLWLAIQLTAAPALHLSNSQFNPESKIDIIFDRAVASEDQVGKKSQNTLLTISPKLPGQLFWKSPNIVQFIPSQAPKMGTNYSFAIANNQKFLNGERLPKGLIQTLQSEPFRVVGSSRRSKSPRYTGKPVYYVYFNDAVDPRNAPAFIQFTNKDDQHVTVTVRQATWGDIKSRYRRGSTWKDRFHQTTTGIKTEYSTDEDAIIPNALMISPSSPLPVGDGWSLRISKKLPNATQTAVHLKGHNIWIGDIDPFELKEAKAAISANNPRQIHLTFNLPPNESLSQDQLASLIQITPTLANAKFKVSGDLVIIDGDLRQQNQWEITIQPTMLASNGLMLGTVKPQKLKFQTVPSGLALPAFDSAQYANGNRLYGIETVNLATVRIRVKQLTPDKAIRTMQGYQHYKGSGHNSKNISPTVPMPYALIDGKTVYDRTIQLDNAIDTSKDISLDWNTILPKDELTTTFFISIEGQAKTEARGGNRVAQSFIQLTDIGLCWKLTDQKALVYAFSCQTGQPLPNVQLQIFNDDAQQAGSTQTDADGLARIPRQKSARHLQATLGKDSYIIPFDNTLDTVALWRFPVDIDWNHLAGWKRTVMMFTDRNLYRPGETVQLKGIARQYLDNQIELTPGKLAKLTITDSASRVLYDQDVQLSKNGTFDHTLKLPAETVGTFTAKLTFPEDPAQADEDSWLINQYRIFRHRFHVQEFRRNAFEITANIPAVAPGAENITLDLEAHYYQGQPVKEGLLQWYFDTTQTGFYPENFRDYLFGDHHKHDPYYWSHYFGYGNGYGHRNKSDRHGEGQLDTEGKSSLTYELPKLTFPTALAVSIHSEITDKRDQTLSNRSKITVHPADTYVGISRVDQLIRTGEPQELNIVAVDPQGKQLTTPVTITATIEREYHEAVKIQSTDGKVSVKNTTHTAAVLETQITIEPGVATALPFVPEHAGKHIITLKGTDKDGHAFATASLLRIYGSKEYPWAVEDGMKIKLVPEKKQYKPGDTARILVMTPIEGTALVTVERSGVHREYRRELKADNPVIEIPLTDLDAPNAFVSVIIIRGADASPRKHKEPALKLGYCTLNVANIKDRLAVTINVEGSQHRPGEPTTITGTVKLANGSPAANAELVLYAEDEGTLAVAGYTNPDPMSSFHAPRPLLVDCGTSFSTFISENLEERHFGNKGFTIGGGDGDAFGGGIALKTRTDFNPCAVWKPTLSTDSNGKFSATFTNPDTLTRYRVIAVALHGQKKFGVTTTDYTVDKPIMLEPAAPRYASEGDQLYPKVLVQNNSKFKGTWEISLSTSSITKATANSPMRKTITLQPGAASTVYFDVTFTSTGKTRWIWTAKPLEINDLAELTPIIARDLSDQAETRFEVTYPVPLMRQFQFITMDNGGQKDLLAGLDPKLLNGRGHIDLALSNSLLLEAGGAVDFLLHYPYGCVEQTTSSMMPWFAVRDLKSLIPGFREKEENDIAQAIQTGADRLLTMQTRDGGLAYWPGGKDPEKWATAYGGLGLILAREHGAVVPDSAIEKLTNWLQTSLNDAPKETADHRWNNQWNTETRTRALYVLALAKKPQLALQNKMLDHVELLSHSARAYLALAMHHSGAEPSQTITLLTHPSSPPRQKHWMRHSANHAMQVFAWSEIAPTNDQAHASMRKMISNRNPYGHWRTTWCNAWALQAMASYARNVEKNRAPSTIQLVTQGATKTITLDANNPTQSLRIPLEKGMKLIISSNNTAHANIKLNSKPAIAPTGPWGHSGLSILRRYERILADGTTQPMNQPRVGDLIRVSLDITFPAALDYVVIEDRLPSLFETVNNNFKSQSSRFSSSSDRSWNISHKELRSDRALFFFDRSWTNGTRTISYLARVTTAGTATAPAAKVEAMYDPEQLALSDSKKLTTLKKEVAERRAPARRITPQP